MGKIRVQWIDAAKFFGIFAIYLGHFPVENGSSLNFVFSYHVPLFFFLSGCTEFLNRDDNFFVYLRKKTAGLLLPFFAFAFVSLLLCIIRTNGSYGFAVAWTEVILRGAVRNTFLAATLWFLTCLFVMSVLFWFIKKIKFRWLILLICLALYFLSYYLISPPKWYYNVDSALNYMIFYAFGYVLFPFIQRGFDSERKRVKIPLLLSGVLLAGYALAVFWGMDPLDRLRGLVFWMGAVVELVRAILLIWFWVLISYCCRNVALFCNIGKNTLYLCGSEYILKESVSALSGVVGLNLTLSTPLDCYIYTFILLLIGYKLFAPFEKRVLNVLCRVLHLKPSEKRQ